MIPSTAPNPPDPTRARYETLLEVAESIAAHRQLSTLFADLSRSLKRLVSFDFIGLTLLDPKEHVVRLHILQTEQPGAAPAAKSTPFDQTPTIVALETRRPYYIPDIAAEERVSGHPRSAAVPTASSRACILPLFTAQRDLGGLHFGSLQANAYTPEDIEFMQQVARQVAVAVDNALNYEAAQAYEEQLARERDRLRTLLEINNAVVGCLDTQAAVSGHLRLTAPHLRAGLRQPADLRRRSHAPAPADARFSGRHRRHSRRRHRAARRQPRRATSSAPAQGRLFSLDEARAISPSTGEHHRAGRAAIALLHAADLARQGAGHAESGLAAAGLLHGRRPAVLHAGRRPGGHRAGQRALLPAHRRTERPAGRGKGLPRRRDPHRQPVRGDHRPEPRAEGHSEAGGDRGAHRFHGADLWRNRHRARNCWRAPSTT